jgi:hypothetical protein
MFSCKESFSCKLITTGQFRTLGFPARKPHDGIQLIQSSSAKEPHNEPALYVNIDAGMVFF